MNKLSADKDIVYYMSLPYTIVLRPDEEGDVVARVQELPGCSAHGSDRNEALKNLQDVQQAWIEECLESGQGIPEPEPEDELPSGKWLQRVPRTLHKKLTDLAKTEEVSLNQLVTSILSEAVAGRAFTGYTRKADSELVRR
jgi:antitoxin HicB